MDIFFYEAFEEEAESLKALIPSHIQAGYTWKTIQEAGDSAPPAPLISIRTQSDLPVPWSGRLGGILSRSTGYDHLTAYLDLCDGSKPRCGYLPLYCNRSVAEQAALLWMALLRKLPQQVHQFKTFHRDGLTGSECAGKNLLVVGVGNIGSQIVQIGRGLSMNVRGVDLLEKHEGVNYISIDEGIGWADIICCAMNLTRENRGYFSLKRFRQAKRGLLFINISRGELSPGTDLLGAIEDGFIAGLALDVYDQERELAVSLRKGSSREDKEVAAVLKLSGMPNVIFTPHNAFNTKEAVQHKVEQTIQQLVHFLDKGRFLWSAPGE